ncbi:hypothetical protein [Pedobacter namyangjuensis]|uniref:hypothetical protein n=1 Tax=Pedobacter namyangjuensis TaxID=600626 RepID=UPI0013B3AACC|nr:hypothetical protein [Pedobacter namyangjuensis]
MKTIKLWLPKLAVNPSTLKAISAMVILALALTIAWLSMPYLTRSIDQYAGLIDPGVWQLLLLACISFITMLALAMLIFNWLIRSNNLPSINTMVLHFKAFNSWQQFVFYWASFALLLLTALLSLVAIF